jgi:hypothetical protein
MVSFSAIYRNELKELKELAIIDILNHQREQILFQLQRLSEVKERFDKFRYNLYHSHADRRTEPLEYFYSLDLDDIFIAPRLYFADHAIADENLIDDLTDSIRARQDILKEFEEAVSKVIDLTKEAETSTNFEVQGIAVREYHTNVGPADYILFVNKKPVGVLKPSVKKKAFDLPCMKISLQSMLPQS